MFAGIGSGVRQCAVVVAAALLSLPVSAPRAAAQPAEQDVKAAFLYHFAQYVEWPAAAFASPSTPLVVGVLGREDAMPAVEGALKGKAVRGRPISVRRLSAPGDASGCHVVFVTSSEARAASSVLKAIGKSPVLTVGEPSGFARSGGAIGLVVRDGRVAFEINPAAAARAGLTVSSKLLRLAEIVDED
jgi:hypothetical protein